MDHEANQRYVNALRAQKATASEEIMKITNAYNQRDEEAVALAGTMTGMQDRVLDELKRAMRCLGEIKVNYEHVEHRSSYRRYYRTSPTRPPFRFETGDMYDYKCRTPRGYDTYVRNLLDYGEDIARGIRDPGKQEGFHSFWEYLRGEEDILRRPETAEPILDIPPRDVYYHSQYAELAIAFGVSRIRLQWDGSYPRLELAAFPSIRRAEFATKLREQVPEIETLLEMRKKKNRYLKLPRTIRTKADEHLGEWLPIHQYGSIS